MILAVSLLTLLEVTLPGAPPKPKPDPAQLMIPTKIAGKYKAGTLIELRVANRMAYLIKPTGKVDPQRRWVWVFPFWLEINDGNGRLHHQFYVDRLLNAGFHIAGINVGTSCGSPTAAQVCEDFYQMLIKQYDLNKRVRLMGQSNGGLMAYAWAFRHPESVDRIGGICPVTDFRTWPPSMTGVITAPDPGLGYNLTLPELKRRQAEFNPVDNLAPLAKAGVKILHIHGDRDNLVPMKDNSTELARRYKKLGGSATVVVIPGLAHGGMPLYESQPLIDFLLAP